VKIVAKATEFKGKVVFDTSKPTGQKKRVLSIELVKKLIDYKPQYSLQKGIQETVDWYKNNYLE
jgi:GDP-L-fucose synthase